MSEQVDLTQLREVAERATPGPWALWLDQDGAEHMNGMLMVGNEAAVIPEGETWAEGVDVNPIACVYTPEDRTHIATFDPPTVLALLDRVEAAEQTVAAYQTRDALSVPVDLDALERAAKAEAAVQRVREVAVEMANHPMPDAPKGAAWILAEGAQLFAKDILEALDGGEQE